MKRTPEAVASSITVLRSQPQNRQKAILVVEGGTDSELFKKFIEPLKCIIRPVGGKIAVVEAIKAIDQRSEQGILGIADADFDIINRRAYDSNNLLYTDCRDIEGVIAYSDSLNHYLFSLIPRQYQDSEQAHHICAEASEIVFAAVKVVGLLRLVSESKNGLLSLDEFIDHMDADTYKIQHDKLIASAWKKNKKVEILPEQELGIKNELDRIEQTLPADHERYLYRGHDIEQVIVWIVPRLFSQRFDSFRVDKLQGHCDTPENVGVNLRRVYESRFFRKTKLFSGIKNWEITNTPYQILQSEL